MEPVSDPLLVRRIVEAALLASHHPLTLAQLAELFDEQQPAPAGTIERALEALREEAPQRGIELVEVASGFRFQVRSEVQPWIARLWADRQTRYSRALLETLALIAYRQPITRGEIEQIRGVAVSSHMVKTLEEREWIRVVGHRDVPGKPALFGTTRTFLDYFGLKSLDQLPPLADLRDLPDLEPQLPLDGAISTAPATAAITESDTPFDPQPLPASGRSDSEANTENPSAAQPTDTEPVADAADAHPDDHASSSTEADAESAAATSPDTTHTPDSTEDDAMNASSEQNA